MAFYPPPIPVIDLVRSYDLTKNFDHPKGPLNLILRDFSYADSSNPTRLTSRLCPHTWFDSSFMLCQTQDKPKAPHFDDDIFLQTDSHTSNWIYRAQCVYFHQAEVIQWEPLTIVVGNKTILTPLLDSFRDGCHPQYWYVEQFSGGFGGWSHAKTYLQTKVAKDVQSIRTVAVEAQLTQAIQYSLTHGNTIVGDCETLQPFFLHEHDQDVTFVCKIQDIHWQQQLRWLPLAMWSISAPCQSWSFAGSRQGFANGDGLALAEAIAQLRIHRPKLVMLEQVAGFSQHEQYPVFQRLITWAGYKELFTDVFDMADLTPVKRNRFLGLYARDDLIIDDFHADSWPHPDPIAWQSFDAVFPLTIKENQKFAPTNADLARYFDPEWMPGKLKVWKQQEILKYRIPNGNCKLPTFMHLYGQQHSLKPQRLLSMGLFGHFQRQGSVVRFWTPVEIAMLHGLPNACAFLKPQTLSWESLGNAIFPSHATFLMVHALKLLKFLQDDIGPQSMIKQQIEQRLRASGSCLKQDEYAWYVGTSNESQALKDRVQFFVEQMHWHHENTQDRTWPEGKFFVVASGLQTVASKVETTLKSIDEISPTIPMFRHHLATLFASPGEYGVIQFDGTIMWQTLLELWDFRFWPKAIDLSINDLHKNIQECEGSEFVSLQEAFVSQDELTELRKDSPKIGLLIREEHCLNLYEVDRNSKWTDVRAMCLGREQSVFRNGVLLHETDVLKPSDELTTLLPLEYTRVMPGQLRLLQQVIMTCTVVQNTDIMQIICRGTLDSRQAWLKFFCSTEMHQWAAQHGRQINYQRIDDSHWQVLYRPKGPRPATPVKLLRNQLYMHMIRQLLYAQTSVEDSAIAWTFKHEGKNIFHGWFPPNLQLRITIEFLAFLHQIMDFPGQPVLISSGKKCGDVVTLFELLARTAKTERCVITHLLEPIKGGGPSSKQDFRQLVESGIASLLMEYGLGLAQTTASTSKLVNQFGLPSLHHLLHGETGTMRYEKFELMCKSAEVSLPPTGPQRTKVEGKFKKIKSQQANRDSMKIDVENYSLKEGFFLNADDTPALVLQQFTPATTGVILMDPQTAQDWLQATSDQPPDELGIYVVGTINVPPRYTCTEIPAPAYDQHGREVLLNGQLVQVGAKDLKVASLQTSEITTNEVQIMAITLWKTDFDENMWNRLLAAPVKTTKDLLALEGFQGILGKPWARTFQDKGVTVTAALASSIQFHCEVIKESRFTAMLRRSGFNRIFMTPKDDTGKASPNWRVIWLDGTTLQIEAKTTNISGVAGLVQGKKSRGIRIEVSNFAAAWEKLRPGQEAPDTRTMKFQFRLQPIPLGIDASILQTWGEAIGWNIKPVKPVGAKMWIVGSDQVPPNILLFNGRPLLATQLYQSGHKSNSAIVAGPKQGGQPKSKSKGGETHVETAKKNIFRQGDPFQDDWAKQLPHNPASASKETSMVENRVPTGPVATLVSQQENRLHAVETAIQKLQDQQQQQSTQAEQRMRVMDENFQQHVVQTQQAFEHVNREQRELHTSIQTALQRQDERMAKSFDDLKALFLSSRGTKRNEPTAEEDELDM